MKWQVIDKDGNPVGDPFVADTQYKCVACIVAIALGILVTIGCDIVQEKRKE